MAEMNTHIVSKAYSNTSTIQLPTFKKNLIQVKKAHTNKVKTSSFIPTLFDDIS